MSLPSWRTDWPALNQQFDWIRALKDCPQDPVYHAEGDVWIHLQMVLRALVELREWQSLPASDRDLVFAAALLHDVAKPSCTRLEQGRISSRGHSQRGAIQARQILWTSGTALVPREQVCSLVRHHQLPFYLIDQNDPARIVRLVSQSTRCDLLTILAKADALGRRCDNQSDLLTKVALFSELCREHDCFDHPWAFPSSLSRFEYAQRADRDPHYPAHDRSLCEVVLMSGLPGAGKDSWIQAHASNWPTVSLDQIRQETGAAPTGNQGSVIQAAKEQARVLLRQHQDFVWNATNLTRERRSQLVDFFTAYQARVRIAYIESTYPQLFIQNQQRPRPVPQHALESLLDHWEVPNPIEAPLVQWWENSPTPGAFSLRNNQT